MLTRRLALGFFLFLVVIPLVAVFHQPYAKAQTMTTVNRTFYSSTNDGFNYKDDTTYTIAHDATTADSLYPTGALQIGQVKSGALYKIVRSYIFFDTTVIPTGAIILNYTLGLYDAGDVSDTDFNITIQKGISTSYPHNPPNMADYYYLYYNQTEGLLSTSGWAISAYNNMTVINGTFINKGGVTNWCLRSDRDINSTTPSGSEAVLVASAEAGAPARLIVWYEAEVYRYVLHGPYYEDGTTAAVTVNVTLYSDFQTPYTFTLPNGSSTYTVDVERKPNHFLWNISDASYNYTRFYWLTTASYEDIYVTLPVPSAPYYLFTVTINDFVGVSNAYLESILYFGGVAHVIERQPFIAGNAMPFYLTFGAHYTFRLTCNRGVKTWEDVIPSSDSNLQLVLAPDDFPGSTYSMNVTLTVSRLNTTAIGVYYTDNRAETINITVRITHIDSTYTSITDLDYSTAANSLSYVWNLADATTDYYVNVTSYKNGNFYTWVKAASHPASGAEPWAGIFDIFGVWPFPARYFLGIGIILSCIAAFSVTSADAGIIITTIVTALLNIIGWVNVSWTLITVALSLGVLEAMHRAKKRELFR